MIQFRPYPVLTIAAVLGVALLLWLGKWQLDRLHWKLDLIAAAETRSHSQPVPVDRLAGRAPKDIEYTHASATGEYLNDKETYLFSQLEDGRIGFDVVTPLRLFDGRLLLVDRGFVPPNLKDPASRPGSEVTGAVRVTGLVRASQKPGLFTPKPDLSKKVWYGRDIAAIGAGQQLGPTLPFMLALDADAGPERYPEGGHTRLTFRNDHLQYALTWFALAGVLLVFYFTYHMQRGRLRFRSER